MIKAWISQTCGRILALQLINSLTLSIWFIPKVLGQIPQRQHPRCFFFLTNVLLRECCREKSEIEWMKQEREGKDAEQECRISFSLVPQGTLECELYHRVGHKGVSFWTTLPVSFCLRASMEGYNLSVMCFCHERTILRRRGQLWALAAIIHSS